MLSIILKEYAIETRRRGNFCCGVLTKPSLNVHLIRALFYSITEKRFQISVTEIKGDLFQILTIKNKYSQKE